MRILIFSIFIALLLSCEKSEVRVFDDKNSELSDPASRQISENCCDLLLVTQTVLNQKPNGCCRKEITFANNSDCAVRVSGLNQKYRIEKDSTLRLQLTFCPGSPSVIFNVITSNNDTCRNVVVYNCQTSASCPTENISLEWYGPLRPESPCSNIRVNIGALGNNLRNCKISKIEFTYRANINGVWTPIFNNHVYQLGVSPNLAAINQSVFPTDDIVPNNVTTDFIGDNDWFVLEPNLGNNEVEVCYTITLDCSECPPITGCKRFTVACT